MLTNYRLDLCIIHGKKKNARSQIGNSFSELYFKNCCFFFKPHTFQSSSFPNLGINIGSAHVLYFSCENVILDDEFPFTCYSLKAVICKHTIKCNFKCK